MNKASLEALFDYTSYAWEEIRRVLPDDSELRRAAPGSGWPALRDCLAHIVLAYYRWPPAVNNLRSEPLPELRPGDFVDLTDLDDRRAMVRRELSTSLATWSDAELEAMHDVDIDGEVVRYTRGELIAHLLLHERGHHGDVTTLFFQLGIDAETALEYRFSLGHR